MKITSWNLENFFVLMDRYKNQDINKIDNFEWESFSSSINTKNKHLGKVEEIAKIIKEIDSDVYLLQEVGGFESLKNFNKYFLNNEYLVYLNEGNSKRGICVGFLIKKKFKNRIKFKTNKNLRLNNGSRIQRDFAQVSLFDENNNLLYVFLNVHLKAQRTSENDFNGITQRENELNALKDIALKLKNELQVPVIIGGDFNIDLSTNYENNGINLDFIDFQDLKKSDIEERCTHIFFSSHRVLNQLDYLLVSNDDKDKIILADSLVYRFKNEYGDNLGLAESLFEKQLFPSDHYPVILSLKD